jgi:hypothetical protein
MVTVTSFAELPAIREGTAEHRAVILTLCPE